MKFNHLFLILLASTLFFYSCKDDDTINNTPYSFSAVLTGFVPGTIDSVYFYQFGGNILGKTKIAENGDFSMTILPPTNIAPINSDNFAAGVVISDKKAEIGDNIILAGMKEGKVKGYIQKSDTAIFILLTDSTAYEGYSSLMYSDRDFTITGVENLQELVMGDSAIFTYNFEIKYDLTFKKGWNEIIYQAGYTMTKGNKINVKIDYNNTVPANFKWRYTPESSPLTQQVIKAGNQNIIRKDILQKAHRLK